MVTDFSRRFETTTTEIGSSNLTCVSIESERKFIDNPDLVPLGWTDEVRDLVEGADTVFVEYFPLEIEQNLGRVPLLGSQVGKYVDRHMTVYKTVADMAAEAETPLHTANIATSLSYLALYEFRPANRRGLNNETGVGRVVPESGEDKKPTATDARRVFTAGAIAQTALQEPGTNIVYVAAPAHVNRVLPYARGHRTPQNAEKREAYHRKYRHTDRTIRTYEHQGDTWTLAARTPIN